VHLLGTVTLSKLQPDAQTGIGVISACAEAHQWQAGLWLLESFRRRNVPPDINMYNAAAGACDAAGQAEAALRLVEDLRRQELSPDLLTYSAVVNACATRGPSSWVSAVDASFELAAKAGDELGRVSRGDGSFDDFARGSL
ncbi:unnamed protein product, partial [Polarella glacialis]